MKKLAVLFSIIQILVVSVVGTSAQAVTADLVVTNANIRTMDAKRTVARSIAVLNGRVVAVGSEADTKPLIGSKTRVIDAKGRTIIPGFNDAHVHFLETGQQLSSVDLRDAKTPEEFVKRIRDFAAKLPKGRWILGGKWDHENWKPNTLPTAALIDAATPDNPVFIDRLDGHMALANTLAMKLAGVNKDTKEVDGGLIVRDAAGNPAEAQSPHQEGPRRQGYSNERLAVLKQMYRLLYRKGLTLEASRAEIEALRGTVPEADADIDNMVSFLANASRGIVR